MHMPENDSTHLSGLEQYFDFEHNQGVEQSDWCWWLEDEGVNS